MPFNRIGCGKFWIYFRLSAFFLLARCRKMCYAYFCQNRFMGIIGKVFIFVFQITAVVKRKASLALLHGADKAVLIYCLIFKIAKLDVKVKYITTDEYPTRAKRPMNSRLSKNSLKVNDFKILENFKDAIDHYLETCKEYNMKPEKQCKGSLNVRLGVELHNEVKLKSEEKNISINEFIKQAVANYLKTC